MAIVTAATAIYGASQSRRAGKDVKRQADNQAALDERATQQQVGNLETEESRFLSTLPVGAVQSGVEADSKSVLAVASEAAKEFRREREFVSEVGAATAANTRQAGRNQRRSYNAQAAIGLLNGITQSAQQSRAAGSWWKI